MSIVNDIAFACKSETLSNSCINYRICQIVVMRKPWKLFSTEKKCFTDQKNKWLKRNHNVNGYICWNALRLIKTMCNVLSVVNLAIWLCPNYWTAFLDWLWFKRWVMIRLTRKITRKKKQQQQHKLKEINGQHLKICTCG